MEHRPQTWDDVVLALHKTIDAHGPITHKLAPSAAYRIISLLCFDKIQGESNSIAQFITEMLGTKFSKRIDKIRKENKKKENEEITKLKQEKEKLIKELLKAVRGEEIDPELKDEIVMIPKSKLDRYKERAHEKHQEMQEKIGLLNREIKYLKRDKMCIEAWQDDGGK